MRKRLDDQLHALLGRVVGSSLFRFVPLLPDRLGARYRSPRIAWPEWGRPVPEDLLTSPGVVRDAAAEDTAFTERPLPDFLKANPQPMTWLLGRMWDSAIPMAPRQQRVLHRAEKVSAPPAPYAPDPVAEKRSAPADADGGDPQLTAALKRRAHELGLSAVGVARFDERYIYEPYQGQQIRDRVVVCILEQNYDTTQTIPSAAAERTALNTYAECQALAVELSAILRDLNYRVQVDDPGGRGMLIPFAVAAGLGQLGLNGQLLTPYAGSRCRIILIFTDAPLVFDEPRDFGITKICDACKVCVRRCPPGAIPSTRRMKRGVEKAPIKTDRCLPIMGLAHGCAVCMKVCPVQRYGLPAVLDHFEATGEVLGKGSDDLEGFDWVDGNHYGPGKKPRISSEIIHPPAMGQISLVTEGPITKDR